VARRDEAEKQVTLKLTGAARALLLREG